MLRLRSSSSLPPSPDILKKRLFQKRNDTVLCHSGSLAILSHSLGFRLYRSPPESFSTQNSSWQTEDDDGRVRWWALAHNSPSAPLVSSTLFRHCPSTSTFLFILALYIYLAVLHMCNVITVILIHPPVLQGLSTGFGWGNSHFNSIYFNLFFQF